MKHFKFTLIFLAISSIAFGQIPSGYYSAANGLEGEPLREALRGIITNGHSSNSYGGLYTAYETTDNYTNGKVWDMYSMKADSTADYWFIHQTDKCGSYAIEGDCYNREHSVPQSWFGSSYPMQADLFMVYPTDGKVNGMRSNYPYGETAGRSISSNGSKKGPCTYSGYTGTVFEPIDRFKGDFARTYFYVATRYKNNVSSWGGNANVVFTGNNLSAWQTSMLLSWHQMDPVSQKEIDRNNAVYPIQHNRNPYIDHPEWVECVWASCSGLNFTSNPVTEATEDIAYTYNITYNVELESETLACTTKPAWLTFTKDEAANTATLSGTPTTADIGSHNVVLKLTENGDIKLQSFTIVVSAWSSNTDVINEDFTNCLPAGWETVNDGGDHDWLCEGGYYKVNGYSSSAPCEDWLITSAINLDDYTNEVLTFDTWTQWNDAGIARPEVKIKYSTDYTGNGVPSSATWTNLAYTYPAEDSQTWTSSGNIDLSGIAGTSVYLAFYYTSSGTNGGAAALWEVDNIVLNADLASGVEEVFSKIKIFPNPVDNILTIDNIAHFSQITIVNALGQIVYTKENKSGKLQINTSNYNSGLHFIRFQAKNGDNFTHKFIKK